LSTKQRDGPLSSPQQQGLCESCEPPVSWSLRNAQVVSRIKDETPQADIRIITCNLEDLVSVAAAANAVLALGLPIHILMLNAGAEACAPVCVHLC
jgi:NAD(P)-dependent dehydrogenase (short-subunit alcohol dehydrogenase family)